MLNDVSQLAKKKQYFPVYASLWQNINAPHEGLMLALEEGIDILDKKTSIPNKIIEVFNRYKQKR